MNKKHLFSGGDDHTIRMWHMESTEQLETLTAHKNGVTSLVFCCNMLVSASFDHYVITWDYNAKVEMVDERRMMRDEDILSRNYSAKLRADDEKNTRKSKKKVGIVRNAKGPKK